MIRISQRYKKKEEVLHDIIKLAKDIFDDIKKEWFKNEWDEKLDILYNVVISDLDKIEKNVSK